MNKYFLATQIATITAFGSILPMDLSMVPAFHKQKTSELQHVSNKPVSQLLKELSSCKTNKNYYPAMGILQDLAGRSEYNLLSTNDSWLLSKTDFSDVFQKLPEYHIGIDVVRKHSQHPHLPEHSILREIQGKLALHNASITGHDLYPDLSDEDIHLAIKKNKLYYFEANNVAQIQHLPGNPENNFRLQMVNSYAAEITLMQGELRLRENRDRLDAISRAQTYRTPTDKSKKTLQQPSFDPSEKLVLPNLAQPEIAPVIQKKDEKLVLANLSQAEKQALALEFEKYSLFMQANDEKLVLPVLVEPEVLPTIQPSADEKSTITTTLQSKVASVIQQSNAMLEKIKKTLADDKKVDAKPAPTKPTNNKKTAAPAQTSSIQPITTQPVVRHTKKSQLALDAKTKNS